MKEYFFKLPFKYIQHGEKIFTVSAINLEEAICKSKDELNHICEYYENIYEEPNEYDYSSLKILRVKEK